MPEPGPLLLNRVLVHACHKIYLMLLSQLIIYHNCLITREYQLNSWEVFPCHAYPHMLTGGVAGCRASWLHFTIPEHSKVEAGRRHNQCEHCYTSLAPPPQPHPTTRATSWWMFLAIQDLISEWKLFGLFFRYFRTTIKTVSYSQPIPIVYQQLRGIHLEVGNPAFHKDR